MTTLVFPGQGSQFRGMAKEFYENFQSARNVFQKVEDINKIIIKDIILEDNEDLLNITKYTQLSIFTASMAIFEVLKHNYIDTDKCNISFVLGHSLGEYSALVAAQTLSLDDCSKILKIRGELMQNAYEENKSGMAAVLGLNCNEVSKIISEELLNIEIANDNAPGQVVVSGIIEDIKKSEKILISNGAKKIVHLNVSAAFHSKIMKHAEEKMKATLSQFNFKNSIYPIVSNYSANANTDSKLIFHNLSKQMSNMVRWTDSIKLLERNKEKTIIEIGPGKVLTGLIKRISSNFRLYTINSLDDFQKLKDAI